MQGMVTVVLEGGGRGGVEELLAAVDPGKNYPKLPALTSECGDDLMCKVW